jgi:hypothetical protein
MYTVEQIRKAGTEGEISSIDVDHLITVLMELYGSGFSQHDGKPIVSGSLPLVEALDKYIELLVEELNETVSMATTHGWKSSRAEEGERQRNRIAELRRQ